MQLTLHPKGGYDIKIIAAIVAIGWLLTHILTSFAQTNVNVGDTANSRWVGTWSASVQKPSQRLPTVELDNQTIRQVVRVSIGGDTVRVRLSNVFGQDTLIINTASVGVRSKDAAVEIGSLHPLEFNGQSSVRIPAGARVYSDPVDLAVEYYDLDPESKRLKDFAEGLPYIVGGMKTLLEIGEPFPAPNA